MPHRPLVIAAILALLVPAAASGRTDAGAASESGEVPLRGKYASRVFLPGLPEIGIFDPGAGLEDVDETRLIQLVYDAYSRYSASSEGDRAEFTFHGFRTVYRDDFSKVAYYPDLVTLSREWQLRAVLVSRYENDVLEGVRYRAEWVPADDLTERKGFAELLGDSVLEIIDVVAGRYGNWRRAVALTSVDLTVELAGQSERYRAGVVWLLATDGTLELVVVDNVVPEVPFAVSETAPPLVGSPRDEVLSLDAVGGASAPGPPTCAGRSWPVVRSGREETLDSRGHASGRHETRFLGEFHCTCTSACTSRCTADLPVQACRDYGDLTEARMIHRATAEVEIRNGWRHQGQLDAAGCTARLECDIESCPAASCGGVTIDVRGGAEGIDFSTEAPAILGVGFSHQHECARCTEVVPEAGG